MDDCLMPVGFWQGLPPSYLVVPKLDVMKHLMTLVVLLVTTAAVAQIPTLPWNPDENGDQFVGLPDLLGLLTVYGQEFQNAIVAEDGESAIMYMGDMAYPLCELSCQELPGIWKMPSISELGLVWNEVFTTSTEVTTWLAPSKGKIQENSGYLEFFISPAATSVFSHTMDETNNPGRPYRCYCTAKQLPRVEYSYCSGGDPSQANFNQCISDRLAEGWYPLSGFPNHHDAQAHDGNNGNYPTISTYYEQNTHASFWRFAQ